MKKALFVLILLFLVSCAGIMENMQSTDTKTISRAPYYIFPDKELEVVSDSVQVLPVRTAGDPDFSADIQLLAREMNNFLAQEKGMFLADHRMIEGDGKPSIMFGQRGIYEDEESDEDASDMVFRITQPSRAWKKKWNPEGKPYTLVLELSVTGYSARVKNLLLEKELILGTGYTEPLPWITSTEKPVTVLQLTTFLLNQYGRIVRAGAEGIYVRPDSFFDFMLGSSSLIDDEDIETVISNHRRKDIPEHPLVWQAALEEILKRMTEK
jgi:hypothetical protein